MLNKIITSMKIRVAIFLVIILLPILFVFQLLNNEVSSAKDDILSNTVVLIKNLTIKQAEIFVEAEGMLRVISNLPEILNHRSNSAECSKKLIDIYTNTLSKMFFSQISVVTPEGFTYCAGKKLQTPLDRREGYPEFWEALKEQKFIVSPKYRIGKASGKPNINTAYPIIKENKVIGVMFLGILLSKFDNVFINQQIPEYVQLYIIDETGVVFLEKHPDEKGNFNKNISLSLPNLIQKLTGTSGVIQLLDQSGNTKYVVYEKIPGTITALAVFSESDIFRSVLQRQQSVLYAIVILSVLSIVVLIGSSIFLKNYLIKDVKAATSIIDQITSNNFEITTNNANIPGFETIFLFLKNMSAVLNEKNKEINKTLEKLKTSNQELEQFAYIASHDLQEPMRRVEFFTSMIKESLSEHDDTTVIDYLNRLEKSANRMRLLISDLLQLSRINSNKDVLEFIPLETVIQTIKSELKYLIDETNATIETNNLPVIFINRVLMEGVFRNLITNSIKFRSDKSPVITISSNTVYENSKQIGVNIIFQDNGQGFDMKYVNKIFDAFFRIERTQADGTGMGLAIVKKTIDRHNGTITVLNSIINEGTTFIIFLPIEVKE